MSVTQALPKEYFDLKKLPLLHRRAIVPHEGLIQPDKEQPIPGRTKYGIIAPIRRHPTDPKIVDLANVQGDIYFKFPKARSRLLLLFALLRIPTEMGALFDL